MGGMIYYDLLEDCIMCPSRRLLMQYGQQMYRTIVFRVALVRRFGDRSIEESFKLLGRIPAEIDIFKSLGTGAAILSAIVVNILSEIQSARLGVFIVCS